jgi:hypothetical protein
MDTRWGDRMVDATVDSAGIPPVHNRLRIGHLLLWMTSTAAVMALFQPERIAISAADDPAAAVSETVYTNWSELILLLAIGPALGAGVAGTFLALWRCLWRRPGFPTQAGHWLLVVMGAATLTVEFFAMLESMGIHTITRELEAFAAWIVPGIAINVAAWFVRSPTRWRVAFVMAAVSLDVVAVVALGVIAQTAITGHDDNMALEQLGAVGMVLGTIGLFVSIVIAVIAGLLDLNDRKAFDLFHWAGVAALDVVVLAPCVSLFVWTGLR